MKKIALLTLLIGLCVFIPLIRVARSAIDNHAACSICGMNRTTFHYSRMLIIYADASETGTCSLRCAALDMRGNPDKTPASLLVGDYLSGELIAAETAVWVIGGAKPGVMSARGKWAFAQPQDAQDFIAEHGGAIAGFAEALEAAYNDLDEEARTLRERRRQGGY